MNHDVFISYSSKNPQAAQAICHELEEHGIRCWMAPRDIPMGSKYASEISHAIKECKAVVLVFSEYSALSQWVESEINIAFSNRKPIIPYKIDTVVVENYDEFYLMLNNRHWIEAYPDYRSRFSELVAVVSAMVGRSAQPSVTPTVTDPNPAKTDEAAKEEKRRKEEAARKAEAETLAAKAQKASDAGNQAEAVKLWRKAAELGNADAQCNLGFCYYAGQGVTLDYAEAVKWFRKAAEQGHADAQYSLGYCYYNSQGVMEDDAEAVKWFRKAAEQGHADAQHILGLCYKFGDGVTKDYAEAVRWCQRAADNGNELAKKNLAEWKRKAY